MIKILQYLKHRIGRQQLRLVKYLLVILPVLMLLAGCDPDAVSPDAGYAGAAEKQTYSLVFESDTDVSEAGMPESQIMSEEMPASEGEAQKPETKTPESDLQAPETETQPPETLIPETQAPETQAPETQAPETQVPETEAGLTVTEDGEYTSKDEVALYLHLYGHLPSNYITKNQAQDAGWVASKGNLWDVCPGKSIGGSRFGNYEGRLPDAKGRKYYECDIDFEGRYRNEKRIIYSNDGLIFYTEDHYETFEQLY